MKLNVYWVILIISVFGCAWSIYAIGEGIYYLFTTEHIFISCMLIIGGVIAALIQGYNAKVLWGFIKNDRLKK